MFAALLDTCVLWPSLQRDVLLPFAVEGLFRPLWSAAILDELEFHEERKLCSRGAGEVAAHARAIGLVAAMRSAFGDAEIAGWEPLEGGCGLPDPDDEHVIAAAVVGGAGAIVTNNVRDFPPDRIPETIEIQTPAVFAHHAVAVSPPAAWRAVEQVAARSGRKGPAHDPCQIVELLEQRYGFTEAMQILRASRRE